IFLRDTKKEDRVKYRDDFSNLISSKLKDIKLTYSDTLVNLVTIVLEDKIILSINLANIDLNKRVYKIFLTNQSLKPSFSYLCDLKLINDLKENLLSISDVQKENSDKKKDTYSERIKKKKDLKENSDKKEDISKKDNKKMKESNMVEDVETEVKILNLFSSDGIFSIEFSILKNLIDFRKLKREDIFYETLFDDKDWNDIKNNLDIDDFKITAVDDKMAYLKNSEKNAKIVRVKDINFTREVLKFSDYKFGENSMHGCIAYPMLYSNRNKKDYFDNVLKEIFFQLEYVLKKNGIFIVLFKKEISKKVNEVAKDYNFKKLCEKDFSFGDLDLTLFSFMNKKLSKEKAKKKAEEMI
ncbi:MAG: hypothetical protein ACOCRX_04290, partial [Candidatus Woesearchaeota archaeon]